MRIPNLFLSVRILSKDITLDIMSTTAWKPQILDFLSKRLKLILRYINGKVFTTTWKPKNLNFFQKSFKLNFDLYIF